MMDDSRPTNEELASTIIETSPIGIGVYDETGACIVANDAMVTLVGATREQLLKQNFHDIASWKESGLLEVAMAALREQAHVRKELTVTTSFGRVAELECHFVPFARGGLLLLANDVSERFKHQREKESLQNQLLQSQKMEAIGQLAGGMAHDFNNMLTIILGNANLGLMGKDEDTPDYLEFKEIMEASERAKELTMKLLTFARKERLNTRTVSVGEVINELYNMLARTLDKKIRIDNRVACGCSVKIDKNQIFQALLNICNNAADAMPGGGRLTLNCGERTDQAYCEMCRKFHAGPYAELEISDTGVGMTDEVRRRIIEPFFTTKGSGKGTGLGLSVTHGIIKGHHGHLEVESEPGEGTTVRVLLPIAEGPDEAKPAQPVLEEFTGTETILVVDDEEPVLRIVGRILERVGYTVLLAPSGKEALELYAQRADEIAAVILDMVMPEMGGEEVYSQLKLFNPQVKVILSSGYSADGKADQLMERGINAFVQKPYAIQTLRRIVRQVLDE
jgi:two-component system, cell cycle sensor histidine kinase and response regulator CckA